MSKRTFKIEDIPIRESVKINDGQLILIRVPVKFNPTLLLQDESLLKALSTTTTTISTPIPNSSMTLDSLSQCNAGELDSLHIHLPHKKSGKWKMVNKAKQTPMRFYNVAATAAGVDDSEEMERVGRQILEAEFCPPAQIDAVLNQGRAKRVRVEKAVAVAVVKAEEESLAKKEKKRKSAAVEGELSMPKTKKVKKSKKKIIFE